MKTYLVTLIALVLVFIIVIGGYLFMQMNIVPTPKEQLTIAPVNNNIDTNTQTTTPTSSSSPSTSPKTYTIDINGFKFLPVTLTIKKGDTITWTNSDTAAHTVTSDAGTELNSPTLSTGKSYSHTFNTVGTFNYHCTIHPSMKAKIIVE